MPSLQERIRELQRKVAEKRRDIQAIPGTDLEPHIRRSVHGPFTAREKATIFRRDVEIREAQEEILGLQLEEEFGLGDPIEPDIFETRPDPTVEMAAASAEASLQERLVGADRSKVSTVWQADNALRYGNVSGFVSYRDIGSVLERIQRFGDRPAEGFVDVMSANWATAEGLKNKIPVRKDIVEGDLFINGFNAMKALEEGRATLADVNNFEAFMRETMRNTTFAGEVAGLMSVMPTWMVEFWLTGGVVKAVGKGIWSATTFAARRTAKKIAREAIEEVAQKGLKSFAKRAAVGSAKLAGVAAGQTLLSPAKVRRSAASRRVRRDLNESDVVRWRNAIGDVFTEFLSEGAGQGLTTALLVPLRPLGRMVGRLPPTQRIAGALTSLSLRAGESTTGRALGTVETILRKGGYSSFLGEFAEERFKSQVLDPLLGIEDFRLPTAEELLIETAALAPFTALGLGARWKQGSREFTKTLHKQELARYLAQIKDNETAGRESLQEFFVEELGPEMGGRLMEMSDAVGFHWTAQKENVGKDWYAEMHAQFLEGPMRGTGAALVQTPATVEAFYMGVEGALLEAQETPELVGLVGGEAVSPTTTPVDARTMFTYLKGKVGSDSLMWTVGPRLLDNIRKGEKVSLEDVARSSVNIRTEAAGRFPEAQVREVPGVVEGERTEVLVQVPEVLSPRGGAVGQVRYSTRTPKSGPQKALVIEGLETLEQEVEGEENASSNWERILAHKVLQIAVEGEHDVVTFPTAKELGLGEAESKRWESFQRTLLGLVKELDEGTAVQEVGIDYAVAGQVDADVHSQSGVPLSAKSHEAYVNHPYVEVVLQQGEVEDREPTEPLYESAHVGAHNPRTKLFEYRLERLRGEGVLTKPEIDLLRVLFGESNMEWTKYLNSLEAVKGLKGALGTTKIIGKPLDKGGAPSDVTLAKGAFGPRRPGVFTLLHELGHVAMNALPWDVTLEAMEIMRDLKATGVLKEYFQDALSGERLEGIETFLADEIEGFAELFSLSLVRRRAPTGRIAEILDMMRTWLWQAFVRVKFSSPSETRQRWSSNLTSAERKAMFSRLDEIFDDVMGFVEPSVENPETLERELRQRNAPEWLRDYQRTLEGWAKTELSAMDVVERVEENPERATGALPTRAEMLQGLERTATMAEWSVKALEDPASAQVALEQGPVVPVEQVLPQPAMSTPRGATEFLTDGRAIIRAFRGFDFSSAVHELFHIWERQASTEQLTLMEGWLELPQEGWGRVEREQLARAFEQYLMNGQAPLATLKDTFTSAREWIRDVYRHAKEPMEVGRISSQLERAFDLFFVDESPEIREARDTVEREYQGLLATLPLGEPVFEPTEEDILRRAVNISVDEGNLLGAPAETYLQAKAELIAANAPPSVEVLAARERVQQARGELLRLQDGRKITDLERLDPFLKWGNVEPSFWSTPVPTHNRLVKTMRMGENALTDLYNYSTRLSKSVAGRKFLELLTFKDEYTSKVIGIFENELWWRWGNLSIADRRWLAQDTQGFTNMQRAFDHSSTPEELQIAPEDVPSPQVNDWLVLMSDVMNFFGSEARRAGVVQRLVSGERRIFRGAETNRLPRMLTREAWGAYTQGKGEIYDTIVAEAVKWNEGLRPDQVRSELRSHFLAKGGKYRKSGQLEETRRIKNMPYILTVPGAVLNTRRVSLFSNHPLELVQKAIHYQANRIGFIKAFGQTNFLPEVSVHHAKRLAKATGIKPKHGRTQVEEAVLEFRVMDVDEVQALSTRELHALARDLDIPSGASQEEYTRKFEATPLPASLSPARVRAMKKLAKDLGGIELDQPAELLYQDLIRRISLETTNIFERLLEMHVAETGDPGGKETKQFLTVLRRSQGIPVWFKETTGRASQLASLGNQIMGSFQVSASAAVNLPQPIAHVPVYVGFRRTLQAIVKAYSDPQTTEAELVAMGAMQRAITYWGLEPGRWLEGIGRNVRGGASIAVGTRFLSQRNNMVAGVAFREMAKYWQVNGAPARKKPLLRDLGLTDVEVASAVNGTMSDEVVDKITRRGVAWSQFVTESPQRKGHIDSHPVWKFMIPYMSYAAGASRLLDARVRGLFGAAIELRHVDSAEAWATFAQELVNTARYLVGTATAGTLSRFIFRSLFYGKAHLQFADDDKSWYDYVLEGFMEAQVFGLAHKTMDFWRYGEGKNLETLAIGSSPKVRFLFDAMRTLGVLAENTFGTADITNAEAGSSFARRHIPATKAFRYVEQIAFPDVVEMEFFREKKRLFRRKLIEDGWYRERAVVLEFQQKQETINLRRALMRLDPEGFKDALQAYTAKKVKDAQDITPSEESDLTGVLRSIEVNARLGRIPQTIKQELEFYSPLGGLKDTHLLLYLKGLSVSEKERVVRLQRAYIEMAFSNF